MFIGILLITLQIEEAFSLKDRRRVVRSLKDRLKARFNASVAELSEKSTVYNQAHIACAVISSSHRHADEQLQEIIGFLDKHGEYDISEISTEVITL